jgi:hypothetical protein
MFAFPIFTTTLDPIPLPVVESVVKPSDLSLASTMNQGLAEVLETIDIKRISSKRASAIADKKSGVSKAYSKQELIKFASALGVKSASIKKKEELVSIILKFKDDMKS